MENSSFLVTNRLRKRRSFAPFLVWLKPDCTFMYIIDLFYLGKSSRTWPLFLTLLTIQTVSFVKIVNFVDIGRLFMSEKVTLLKSKIAQKLGTSLTQLNRYIKEKDIIPDHQIGKRYYYNFEDFVDFNKVKKIDRKEVKLNKTNEINKTNENISFLQKQLEAKDMQIKKLQDQLETSTKSIAQLATQAQQLNLLDKRINREEDLRKQIELLRDENEKLKKEKNAEIEQENNSSKKRNWWQKLFNN